MGKRPNKPVHNRDPEPDIAYVPGLRIKNVAKRIRRVLEQVRSIDRRLRSVEAIVKPGEEHK